MMRDRAQSIIRRHIEDARQAAKADADNPVAAERHHIYAVLLGLIADEIAEAGASFIPTDEMLDALFPTRGAPTHVLRTGYNGWLEWQPDRNEQRHRYASMVRGSKNRVEHPDELAVDLFAARMKAKMAAARDKGRGGWDDPAQCSVDYLRDMLHDHVAKGDPVDVANFCMMLFHRGGLASAPAEPLPDIGPDPFKGPREDDRYEGSRLRLRAAYAQQQKGVPDQTALVWRYDLGTVLEMAIRLKSILADDEEPASAPAGDGVSLREALSQARHYVERKSCDAFDDREDKLLAVIDAALARPRAAVGEQVAMFRAGYMAAVKDYAHKGGEGNGDIAYHCDQAWAALQSPLAKVEE